MRFLMLNWRDPKNPLSGGAERVTEAYLRSLLQRGHEIFWFSNLFPGASQEENLSGMQIVRGGGRGTSILAARRWHQKQKRFDLVIDQHHGLPWFAPWWCGTRCLAYIHEVLGPIWNSFYPWPLSAIGRAQEYWTHRLYSQVSFWVPSESTRQNLLQRGVKNITVIPNGVETVPLSSLPPKPLQSPMRLAVVSRLAPNKRIDHAIETVKILRDRKVNTRLRIVGTGEKEHMLRAQVKQAGLESFITFCGRLDEAAKNHELQEAHFLIHTSVREGWGLNVLEANAMGTPAVVYPVEGLVDSTLDGETGWVSANETPSSLADTLQARLNRQEEYGAVRLQAWERTRRFQWPVILPAATDWLENQAAGTPRDFSWPR